MLKRRVISCLKRIHAYLEVGCLLVIRRSVIQRQEQSLHSHSWGKLYHKAILGRQTKVFRVGCAPWTLFCLDLLWEIFFFSSSSLKYSENHVWVYHGSDFTVWWQSYLLNVTAVCQQCSVVHSLSRQCGGGLWKLESVKSDSWYLQCGWRRMQYPKLQPDSDSKEATCFIQRDL